MARYLENEGIDISMGIMKRTSYVHKFGAVPAMSQNQTGSIWDIDDTKYPWGSFASAGTLSIPAVNAADNGHVITLLGLDSNFDEISEEITVSSSAAVTTTNSFIRVYRAYNGTSDNTGNIDVQKGGTTVLRISAGQSQTLMGVYTIPDGYTGYLMKATTTCAAGADATINMFMRFGGEGAFRIGHTAEISGSGGQYMYDFTVPPQLPERTDIDIRATVRSNNARVTTAFDIILVKDNV